MDIVYIRGLKIDTVIGIYDWERRICQTISIDLEMGTDIRRAAGSDSIDDALNYKAVAKRLIAYVEVVITEFQVPWLHLRLSKPGAVRGAQDVGIIIERGSKG